MQRLCSTSYPSTVSFNYGDLSPRSTHGSFQIVWKGKFRENSSIRHARPLQGYARRGLEGLVDLAPLPHDQPLCGDVVHTRYRRLLLRPVPARWGKALGDRRGGSTFGGFSGRSIWAVAQVG